MEAKLTIDIIRRIRHDFANHLQVISGYLELERYQQLKEYVAEIVRDISEDKEIFDIGLNAEETLCFYEKTLAAREMGIILRYGKLEISSLELSRLDYELDKALNELSHKFRGKEKEAVVHLSILSNDNETTLLFYPPGLRQNPVKISFKE